MNPFLFFVLAVVIFCVVVGLARALRAPKPFVNSKLQASRAHYLSGKSTSNKPYVTKRYHDQWGE